MIVQKKKKILVVDDNFFQLESLEKSLKNEYNIITAKSGNEAIKLVESREFIPDLILLDMIMPLMDGLEVLHKLKKMNHIVKVPILLMTSVSVREIEVLKMAYESEVAGYIQKSNSNEELFEKIKKYLV
jgi:response regulator RpfG family c-di-GMP phosphodiesterase